jgi:hypothetical protein
VEFVLVFIARLTLGIFLSVILGAVCYFTAIGIAHPVSLPTPGVVQLVGVLSIGVGAGSGAFLGWLQFDLPRRILLALVSLSIAAALLGGFLGLQVGREIRVDVLGIPELRGIFLGAVLGGNGPSFMFRIGKAVLTLRDSTRSG